MLRRTYDNVRMEIASWTTIGILRTGNEDGYAVIHACEARQDDMAESALILLADGMGGYEAGEIAAALAIQVLRKYLVAQKGFERSLADRAFRPIRSIQATVPKVMPAAAGCEEMPVYAQKRFKRGE